MFEQLAIEKLTRVFGDERGNELYRLAVSGLGGRIQSLDDLRTFADALEKHGTMEGAVAGLLRVKGMILARSTTHDREAK